MRKHWRWGMAALLLAGLVGGVGYAQRTAVQAVLFNLTGETALGSQVRALGMLALDQLRPPLDLQPEAPSAHTGVNPYGLNTFLQQEVEPAKRARQVQLIADAGFHWLRQEFPWADIEVCGKGNFEDCRNEPRVSAWDKYDQIVDLAEAANLEIIARLSSPPNWARADGAARGDFAPPDDFTDFGDYAAAVAERYRGRLHYFQIWNEPNGNAEWGYQPVDPEAYTRLLCQTYARLKQIDPANVILAAALTPTNELGGLTDQGYNNLNEFVYLQRMYSAGAGQCFDILSAQAYGLFSGPTDHRLSLLQVNYQRPLFLRDLMVRNGDAHKAIWVSEMNWNAVPEGLDAPYGRVTEAQQAEYAPRAYARAQAEWPWLGVSNFWFFKRPDESEQNQPWYYFRMADPDFTLHPVYYAMQAYTHQPAVMYPGWFQEDHWAVQWDAAWQATPDPQATLGGARVTTAAGAAAHFIFSGTELWLVVRRGPAGGQLTVWVDDQARTINLYAPTETAPVRVPAAEHLHAGQHTVDLVNNQGRAEVDGFIVRRRSGLLIWAIVGLLGAIVLIAGWQIKTTPAASLKTTRPS